MLILKTNTEVTIAHVRIGNLTFILSTTELLL